MRKPPPAFGLLVRGLLITSQVTSFTSRTAGTFTTATIRFKPSFSGGVTPRAGDVMVTLLGPAWRYEVMLKEWISQRPSSRKNPSPHGTVAPWNQLPWRNDRLFSETSLSFHRDCPSATCMSRNACPVLYSIPEIGAY